MSGERLKGSPTEEVVAKVNKLGLTKAAEALGTSPATLCRWLKTQGFFRKTQYIKENQTAQKFQTA